MPKIHSQVFTSFNSLLEKAIHGEPNDLCYRDHERASRETNPYFNGTKSFLDAVDIATKGWPEGREIIARYTKEYGHIWQKFFPSQDWTNKLQTSDGGGAIPHVENFLLGLPDDMLTFIPDEENSKTGSGAKLQRIIVNGGASSYIKIETIFQFGGLISALVNSMEMSGFNVELNIVWYFGSSMFAADNTGSTNDDVRFKTVLKVKNFSEMMDVDKLAFCLAHSSMLRRFILSLIEQGDDDVIHKIKNNRYGYPINLEEENIAKFGMDESGELKHGNMYFKLINANYTLDQMAEQCSSVVKQHFTEVSMNDGSYLPPISPNHPN